MAKEEADRLHALQETAHREKMVKMREQRRRDKERKAEADERRMQELQASLRSATEARRLQVRCRFDCVHNLLIICS